MLLFQILLSLLNCLLFSEKPFIWWNVLELGIVKISAVLNELLIDLFKLQVGLDKIPVLVESHLAWLVPVHVFEEFLGLVNYFGFLWRIFTAAICLKSHRLIKLLKEGRIFICCGSGFRWLIFRSSPSLIQVIKLKNTRIIFYFFSLLNCHCPDWESAVCGNHQEFWQCNHWFNYLILEK